MKAHDLAKKLLELPDYEVHLYERSQNDAVFATTVMIEEEHETEFNGKKYIHSPVVYLCNDEYDKINELKEMQSAGYWKYKRYVSL